MVSAQFLKKLFEEVSTKFGTQKHQGKARTRFEPSDLDLIFKVTKSYKII